MNIKCVKVGELETNCYILEKDNNFLIIDPGDEFEKIRKLINGSVVGILVTHNHFDHVGALDECVSYYDTQVYNCNNLNEGNQEIHCFKFDVKYNFGHTMDSISFIFDNVMFTGDFVFKDFIGRWDLGGDYFTQQESIRILLKNKTNYKLYPGHGESTYLDDERNNLQRYI